MKTIKKTIKPIKKTTKPIKKTTKKLVDFSAKKHIKMTDLAKELGMHYNSMFAKQKLVNIWSIKALDNERKVVCFTKEDAQSIRKRTAPIMTDKEIDLLNLEKTFKLKRSDLKKALNILKIKAEKRRRKDNKTVPAIDMKYKLPLERILKKITSK